MVDSVNEPKASILIVDDIPDTVQLLKDWLENHNYKATGVTSSLQALEIEDAVALLMAAAAATPARGSRAASTSSRCTGTAASGTIPPSSVALRRTRIARSA
jgi:hypothetical protein